MGDDGTGRARLCVMTATPALLERVREAQKTDKECKFVKDRLERGEEFPYWTIHKDGSLRYAEQVSVPDDEKLREEVLNDHHCSSLRLIQGVRRCTRTSRNSIGGRE